MACRLGQREKTRRRRAIIRRDGDCCRYCGFDGDLTIDHILPKSLGGTNRIENLQLLCLCCNQAKGDTGAGKETVLRWRGLLVAA